MQHVDIKGKLKPPIFLLGNVRSGTTMIQRFFNLHPEIITWFEPRPIWNYAHPWRQYDYLDENDASPNVIRYIRRKFLKYQNKNHGLRIMEKTPRNVVRISFIHRIFPESKFIYMVRDPLAQISSAEVQWKNVIDWRSKKWAFYRIKQTPIIQLPFYAHKFFRNLFYSKVLKVKYPNIYGVRYKGIDKDRKNLTTLQIIAKQWAYCVRQAEKDLAKLDQKIILRMKYEDFVKDPLNNFDLILQHFELKMTEEISKAVLVETKSDRLQKWKRFPPDVIESCIPFIKDEMENYGYLIPDDL